MANRKTFNDFKEELPKLSDYVIGYSNPVPEGERRFRLADLKGFVRATEVVKVIGNTEFSDTSIHGKFFHLHDEVHDGKDLEITLPNNPDMFIQFGVVNMTEHKSVVLNSKIGKINSNGNTLRKKYDTAILYWDGVNWNAYGHLSSNGGMDIKTLSENYTFERKDADCIMHITSESDIEIVLPDPKSLNLISGTQFYIYNLSNIKVTLNTETGVELHARSRVLRRKFDDVLVYTDGNQWFATGDLT
jgi:hypothetical protein